MEPQSNSDRRNEPFARVEEVGTGTLEQPDLPAAQARLLQPLLKPALWVILVGMALALHVHMSVAPQWREQQTIYEVFANDEGDLVYIERGTQKLLPATVPYDSSPLRQSQLDRMQGLPPMESQWVVQYPEGGGAAVYSRLAPQFHLGPWSLLPALLKPPRAIARDVSRALASDQKILHDKSYAKADSDFGEPFVPYQ